MLKYILSILSVFLMFSTSEALTTEDLKVSDRKINFDFSYLKRCHLGDLDLISMEARAGNTDDNRLIASIEALPESKNNLGTTSAEIFGEWKDLLTLLQGGTLTLPRVEKPTLAGFFICRDSKNSGKCSDKKALSFEKVASVYSVDSENIDTKTGVLKKELPKIEVEDKLYYFRPVLITKEGISFFPKSDKLEDFQEIYNTYQPEVKNESSIAAFLNKKLGSFSLKLSEDNKTLMVQLPYYVAEKCNKIE